MFVPYCTGDVHAGSKPDGDGGRHFVGYGNVGLDLAISPRSDGTGEHFGTWLDEMLDPKATWNSVAP